MACRACAPGFAEEAALAVSQAPVEALDVLFDAGLLESSGAGRYTLHQTIADYANAHLAEIGARSGRDLDTDGLIIPGQYAVEYSQHMSERDRARTQERTLDAALETGAERLRLRLAKPRSARFRRCNSRRASAN